MEGSSRCFSEEQLICTKRGNIKIKDINLNDEVLSFNHDADREEFKKVYSINKQQNKKPCFKITMNDGTIIQCTKDHKFYYKGRYIELENILSLYKKGYGNMEEIS